MIKDAAAEAGLTPTGFAAEAAVRAARGEPSPSSTAQMRAALVEVMKARAQVRRYGALVNQAQATTNSTGEAPAWTERAGRLCNRAVERLATAAAELVEVIP